MTRPPATRFLGPTAASRRGFLLAVILMISAVAAALALALHQGMLHRSVQVQLASDRAAARFLARGALDVTKFAILEAALPPPPGVAPSTRGPDLFSFLLSSREVLARGIPRPSGANDDRTWLESKLSSTAFASLDRLSAKLPDARTRITVALATPAAPAGAVLPACVRDPVIKHVELAVTASARVRQAEDTFSVTLTFDVYSRLPVAGKFTLAATRAGGLATARVSASGGPYAVESDQPVVLIHHPSDGDPLATDPFLPAPAKPLVARAVPPSAVVTAHADRGLVWLSTGAPDRPDVHLPLAAGGAPFGEQHALFAPQDGRAIVPTARQLADQPAPMRAFQAADPLDPEILQGALVQGTVLPLFEGLDPDLLGPHPDPELAPSTAVSRLKVHGTQGMPSATAVIGRAFHTLAALADIATDRDISDTDEHAQASAAGRGLPVRDGIEPFLAYAEEAAYEADVAAEQGTTEPAYSALKTFGRQGEIPNLNAYIDQDGDGSRETQVASEVGHNPIHLDLSLWKYGSLFANYAEYRRFMSRYLSIPVNLSLELAARPAEQTLELLRQAAFGKSPPGGWNDWLVTSVSLAHRDPLHQEPAVKAGGELWLDSGVGPADGLALALSAPTGERYPGEPAIVVRGQRKFEEHFMPGGVMDLQGLRVIVVPAEGEIVPGLAFDRVVAVKPGSGGVLEVPRLTCPGLVNGDGPTFAPLCVRAAELVLIGRGPFEAAIRAGRVSLENAAGAADPGWTVIRGALSVDAVPTGLPRPLVVAWDPRLDPTGPAAAFSYRIAAAPTPRVYAP